MSSSSGRAPASLSTQSSSVGCALCCTTATRRPSTTRTWSAGGGLRECAIIQKSGLNRRQWNNECLGDQKLAARRVLAITPTHQHHNHYHPERVLQKMQSFAVVYIILSLTIRQIFFFDGGIM